MMKISTQIKRDRQPQKPLEPTIATSPSNCLLHSEQTQNPKPKAMFEESVSSLPSIWAFMNSWLTPTVLFLLLNLMIGTIVIASSLGTQKHHQQDQHQQHHHYQHQHQQQGLARSPSVLQRFKSINLYNYRSPEPATNYEKAPESETHFVHQVQQPQLLPRSPSMLERLQSFKFQFHFPKQSSPLQTRDFVLPDPEPEAQAHYTTYDRSHEDEAEETEHNSHDDDEVEELDEDQFEAEQGEQKEQTLDEIYRQLQLHDNNDHVSRTTSDTKPASGEVPPKLPNKMKKSASAKSAFAHFAAEDIVESRRPATVKEKKTKANHEDEEVDAKADDFINRFKQQLKLQRLDSIIRYKDMITRGSDN